MYPLDLQYKSAVENNQYPPDNGGYHFSAVKEEDEVIFSSGGKAVVFKVTDDRSSKTKALKFFTIENRERFDRYEKISRVIKKLDSSFFVDFDFVPKMIYVNIDGQAQKDNYFPGLVMDWAEGVTLGTKLKNLVDSQDKSGIKRIAKNFKELSLFLLKNNIGHGDLKHDNIIVNENLELILVDYDGMYVNELSGYKSTELGTDSFQHPKRNSSHFKEGIDDFSILTIYTSLVALSVRPDLYLDFNDQQNLLFKKEDFENPTSSKLFAILSQLSETKRYIFFIKKSIDSNSIYIDNIVDLLNNKFPKPKLSVSHTPVKALVGEFVKISWQSDNLSFVTLNGSSQPLNGFIEEVATKDHRLIFRYGDAFETYTDNYSIECLPKPEIVSFNASETAIKFDENLSLNWEAKNFKKAIIRYGQNEIDVTDRNKYVISGLSKDTTVTLILHSLVNNFKLDKSIKVEVYYPVSLEINQEKKITFPNRAVRISIDSKNEQKLTLSPLNIDLTGKKEYLLKTDRDISYSIVAENKRYSVSRNSAIEVLKPPAYTKKVIELPKIEFKISAPQFVKFQTNSIKRTPLKIDWVSIKFNNIMDRVNIFKLLSKNELIK